MHLDQHELADEACNKVAAALSHAACLSPFLHTLLDQTFFRCHQPHHMFDAVWLSLRLSQPPLCPSGGAWVGPDVGSTVAWQDTADNRAPLVASVLEQFGRMTALAKETTSNLLTSTAYWGAQPGQHNLTSLHHAVHKTLRQLWMQFFCTTIISVMPALCKVLLNLKYDDTILAGSSDLKVLRLNVTWSICIRLQHSFMRQPMLHHRQPEHTNYLLLRPIWLLSQNTSAISCFEDHRHSLTAAVCVY